MDPTPNPQEQSRLCCLPGELRNRIYELVVHSESAIEITDDPSTSTQPAITRVCRLLRNDALSVFYSINTFRAEVRYCDRPAAGRWISAIGCYRARHMCKLELLVDSANNFEGSLKCFIDVVRTTAAAHVCKDAIQLSGYGEEYLDPENAALYRDTLYVLAGYPDTDETPPCRLCNGGSGEKASSDTHVTSYKSMINRAAEESRMPKIPAAWAPSGKPRLKSSGNTHGSPVLPGSTTTLDHPQLPTSAAAPNAEQMVTALSKQTNMNARFSHDCLVQTGWNLTEALKAFDRVKESVPKAAFLPQTASTSFKLTTQLPDGLSNHVAERMVSELSMETGMTIQFCNDCLEQTGWDLVQAREAFERVKSELPPEAFASRVRTNTRWSTPQVPVSVSAQVRNQKMAELIGQTGLKVEYAEALLEEGDWDLEHVLRVWNSSEMTYPAEAFT